MKKAAVIWAFPLALALAAAAQSQPLEIEIKGLKIGMTKAEVGQKFGVFDDFSIAGVSGHFIKYTSPHNPKGYCVHGCYGDMGLSPLSAVYDVEGRLEYWRFAFSPISFDKLKMAVSEKYPVTVCKESVVVNGFGAQFQQEICTMQDEQSVLTLSRYSGNRDRGSLSVSSKKSIERTKEKNSIDKKDI